MPFRRRRRQPPPVGSAVPQLARETNGGPSRSTPGWTALLRRLERKRRTLIAGDNGAPAANLPTDYVVRATSASFRMEGLDATEAEVREALSPDRPLLLPRQAQRLRNHAAILHHVENDLQQGVPLTNDGVVRWYVAVSAGLSTTGLDPVSAARLDEVVRRINSPHLRMQPALQEIASTHLRLLTEPLTPSFNGILARLLLRYHLGRCKLPPILFDPAEDGRPTGAEGLLRRIVELLEASYDDLLGRRAHGT